MFYADNQPDYYTSRPPELREVQYDILAKGEQFDEDESGYEYGRRTMLIEVKKVVGDLDRKGIESLLANNHTSGWCGHEHDCCGCWYSHAIASMLTMDTARVDVFMGRNY